MQSAVAEAANAVLAASLPCSQEFHYLQATCPAFAEQTARLREQALSLLGRFEGWPLSYVAEDPAAIAEGLTSLLDVYLDRCDAALDELRAAERGAGGGAAPAAPRRTAGGGPPPRYVSSLARPQDSFADRVDNSHAPFVLPHPLGHPPTGDPAAHPLSHLIAALLPARGAQLQAEPATVPAPPHDTPCTLVDTPAALEALAERLRGLPCVAVDLEAHSYRSFQGFTCLMQLSTRTEDYLVDTLALRAHIRPGLARFFQDPNTVKVMHGAESDVTWLQRDFGIYVVNLFDTGQAARLLGFLSAGLAHCLLTLCAFTADKRYQLADWRLRPLSADMVAYARADTHFLLFVYDTMKRMLLQTPPPAPPGDPGPGDTADDAALEWMYPEAPPRFGALPAAWSRSARVSLRTYSKEAFQADGHVRAAQRAGKPLSQRSLRVLGALWAWRDATARAEDESRAYILPKAALFRLADAAPTTARDVAAACGREAPATSARAEALAALISRAKADFDAAAQLARAAPTAAPPTAMHTRFGEAAQPPSEHAVLLEAAQPPPPLQRKRRILVAVAAPVAGTGLGAALAVAENVECDAAAAKRVRHSLALPFQ